MDNQNLVLISLFPYFSRTAPIIQIQTTLGYALKFQTSEGQGGCIIEVGTSRLWTSTNGSAWKLEKTSPGLALPRQQICKPDPNWRPVGLGWSWMF